MTVSLDRYRLPPVPLITAWTVHLQSRHLSPATVRIRTYHLRRLARHTPLEDVTLDVLEQVLAAHADYAPETAKSLRSSWRGFYQWAHRTGRLPTDPTVGLAPIRIPVTVPRIAPDDEIARAIASAPMRERAMLQLGRLACLRLSEIATLHTDDRQDAWLHVIGKGSKQRRLYLHPDVAATLDEIQRVQGSGWYFPGQYGHLHPQSVHKLIVRACGHNPHSLRHAGATAAYNATRDLRAVQQMLGHSSMAVTQRYLHCDDAGLRAVALGTAIAA